jgi:hypothetical protein
MSVAQEIIPNIAQEDRSGTSAFARKGRLA